MKPIGSTTTKHTWNVWLNTGNIVAIYADEIIDAGAGNLIFKDTDTTGFNSEVVVATFAWTGIAGWALQTHAQLPEFAGRPVCCTQ